LGQTESPELDVIKLSSQSHSHREIDRVDATDIGSESDPRLIACTHTAPANRHVSKCKCVLPWLLLLHDLRLRARLYTGCAAITH